MSIEKLERVGVKACVEALGFEVQQNTLGTFIDHNNRTIWIIDDNRLCYFGVDGFVLDSNLLAMIVFGPVEELPKLIAEENAFLIERRMGVENDAFT